MVAPKASYANVKNKAGPLTRPRQVQLQLTVPQTKGLQAVSHKMTGSLSSGSFGSIEVHLLFSNSSDDKLPTSARPIAVHFDSALMAVACRFKLINRSTNHMHIR